MRLAETDVLPILRRLRDVYTLPKGMTPTGVADAWVRALSDVSATELSAAADTYLRSDSPYWPRPGKLRVWIMQDRAKRGVTNLSGRDRTYAEWERDGMPRGEPCPVCESVLEWGEKSARLHVWHDPQRHREAHVLFSGPLPDRARHLMPWRGEERE